MTALAKEIAAHALVGIVVAVTVGLYVLLFW